MISRQDRELQSLYIDLLLESELGDTQTEEKSLSPEDFVRFENKLAKAKFDLYKSYPFIGVGLTKLHTVPTYSIPTMAVDNFRNIYINPDFALNTLSPSEVTGVLAHEVMHIMNLTFFRLQNRDHELWNIATDFMMNRDLLEMGLDIPKLALLPTMENGKAIVKVKAGNKMESIDISGNDFSCEDLYAWLKGLQDKLPPSPGGKGQPGQGQPGQGQGGKGQSGQGETIDDLAERQEKFDKHIEKGDEKPVPLDVPSNDDVYKPADASGKTESQLHNEAKDRTQSSKQTAERLAGKQGAGVPRGFSEKILKTATDWKNILRKFITSSSSIKYDWSSPSKRGLAAGYYAPRTRKIEDDIDIVVGLDTSGSIGPDLLGLFVSEVVKIAASFKRAKIKVLLWNTEVYREINIDTSKKSLSEINKEILSTGFESGGTTLSSIKTYLDKKNTSKKPINGLVVFTDGEISDVPPQLPKMAGSNRIIFMIPERDSAGNVCSDEIVKRYGKSYIINVQP